MADRVGGVLGQLLLALDRTMVTLVDAPRGLDMPVGSVALVDADDIRLGLAVGAGNADAFFLLGVSDVEALRWLGTGHAQKVPAAIFVKEPRRHAGGGRSRPAQPSSPSNPALAGNGSIGWSRTCWSITATVMTRHSPLAQTFSGSRSRSPNAPTG